MTDHHTHYRLAYMYTRTLYILIPMYMTISLTLWLKLGLTPDWRSEVTVASSPSSLALSSWRP